MLDIHRSGSTPDMKFYFSHSVLPSYIDPQNVSTKKKPFSTFHKQHFSHTLHLVLPEETWELVRTALRAHPLLASPYYARVHLSLSDILSPEFLDYYIKTGNIMMLSEGRPLTDAYRFELYEGKLKIELDRPTYERCGLQGTPIEDGGAKHQKQRWIVEYDLRSPSMKHGKKGFARLEWAGRNVLDRSLTWLFYNFNAGDGGEALREGREVLSQHAPWIEGVEPSVKHMRSVLVPRLHTADLTGLYDQEEALGLLEYLHMLHLDSPRVYEGDDINPHLSRYEVPDFGRSSVSGGLVQICWKGFMAPSFARELFLLVREQGFKAKSKVSGGKGVDMDIDVDGEQVGDGREEKWFSMSAQEFGGKKGWTVMQFAGRETLVWEVEG
ncbi:Nn.00g020840.m01.CDS01 [Neocucurbitaria sp. VM-36]